MNNHRNSHLVFSIALLFIFVVGSFFVLLFETKGYSKIQDTIVLEENTYTPLSYIHTKCKTNDTIIIEKIENKECLVFLQEDMKTYLYFDNGYLKELYASDEYHFSLSDGNELFKVDDFQLNMNDSLLQVNIIVDDVEKSLYIDVMKGGYPS